MFGLGRRYTFRRAIVGATAGQPLLQIQAPATRSIALMRAYIGQSSSETSLQTAVRLARKSTAATVTAAVANDIANLDPNDTASGVQLGVAATGHSGTTTGTTTAGGGVIVEEAWNLVGNGWLWLPVPEGRIVVPANGLIALEPVETIATFTFHCGIEWIEL